MNVILSGFYYILTATDEVSIIQIFSKQPEKKIYIYFFYELIFLEMFNR